MSRIDTHHHVIPPAYRSWLADMGYHGGQSTPEWSVASSLSLMDDLGIELAIASVSRPGVHFGDDAQARVKAREINEYCAELAKDRPDRFGFFAMLPLPDVDGSLAEIDYALDELSADGVVVLTNVDGTYVGCPEYEPVMAELDRREAVMFVHPTQVAGATSSGVPPFVADFLLDTTRAAVNLARSRAMSRYGSMKIILSHGGGFVPYAADRITQLIATIEPDVGDAGDLLDELRRCYFDTALTAGSTSLPCLLTFAGVDRVLFGSDYPYAPGGLSYRFTEQLDGFGGLTEQEREQVNHRNARAVLKRA